MRILYLVFILSIFLFLRYLGLSYNLVVDKLVNILLGIVGEFLFRKIYSNLKKNSTKREKITFSIGAVTLVAALKEIIDSSTPLKSFFPPYLRWMFCEIELADPSDLLANVLGSFLSSLIFKERNSKI